MKKKIDDPALKTWDGLNKALMSSVDEDYFNHLMAAELAGRRRKQFLSRIHSRLNKVRADRERKEFGAR